MDEYLNDFFNIFSCSPENKEETKDDDHSIFKYSGNKESNNQLSGDEDAFGKEADKLGMDDYPDGYDYFL